MKWILYVLLAPSLVLVLPEVAMGECNLTGDG